MTDDTIAIERRLIDGEPEPKTLAHDCLLTIRRQRDRIVELEAAIVVRDDTIKRLRADLFKARVRLGDILPGTNQ